MEQRRCGRGSGPLGRDPITAGLLLLVLFLEQLVALLQRVVELGLRDQQHVL